MNTKINSMLVGTFCLVSLACPAQSGSTQKERTENKQSMNTTITGRNIVTRLYDAMNRRENDRLSEFISPDYIGAKGENGPTAFIQPLMPLIKAFPDIRWDIKDLIEDENRVAVRWIWQGTQRESYLQFPATNKLVTNEGMAIFELREDKIIKSIALTDRLGFLQQLDVLPADVSKLQSRLIQKEQVNFIDRFTLPVSARAEFLSRMNVNRSYIRNLPGFVQDQAFEQTDEHGKLIIITVATWQNEQALAKAKESVQNEYRRTGFNPAEFYQRLNISLERNICKAIVD